MSHRAIRRVNIVYADNGQGLTRDAHVLRGVLTGLCCRVTLTPRSPMPPPLAARFAKEHLTHAGRRVRDHWRTSRHVTAGNERWDVNIFLESIALDYMPLARTNWFIPNQEWLTDADRSSMRNLDLVLFKTRHAEQALRDCATHTSFVGFTSDDRRDLQVLRDWNRALHVAGWSTFKGTGRLLPLWHRHPEWPRLSVVAQGQASPRKTDRVDLISTRLPEPTLRELQNRCGLHVIPSEVEGYGHSLNDALSCGAILVTTNAPPMNELAPDTAAVFVAYESTEQMASGVRFRFSEDALAAAMERICRMPESERVDMGRSARDAFEKGHKAFTSRLGELLTRVKSNVG